MIVDLIVAAVLGVFSAVLALLPDFTFALGGVEAVAMARASVNNFVPLDEIIAATGLIISVRIFVGNWAWFKWLWDQLPFKAR